MAAGEQARHQIRGNRNARLVDDDRAIRISIERDAEVGGIFGIGFAPNSGGPFSYLDRLGLDGAVARLEDFAATLTEKS